MTLTFQLSRELEERLIDEATRLGVSPESIAIEALELRLSAASRQERAMRLLQSWLDDGDVEEDRETGDLLIRLLDEDRLSDRKLFPPETQGVSW
jgi:hypothetical protein